ncbi:hypothetical protein E1091_00220 [Micromonospora fluostatini]|uniref:Uncharacterized protein n=1 Tax=Micromonospora fluostatini TaxID=1629071 RepID=A0ABY2DN00_9ACTN|nr:hypothetical protein E1091_00220 [Micromonospora fluostatini]
MGTDLMSSETRRCTLPVGTFVRVSERGSGRRYAAVVVGYDLGCTKYEVGRRFAGWASWRYLNGGSWPFPAEVEEIPTREFRYDSENLDGKEGVVTYTVPSEINVTCEAHASDNALRTRWDFLDGTTWDSLNPTPAGE